MTDHIGLNNSLLTIIERCEELVFFTAKDGHIKYASSAVQKTFGFNKEEYLQFNLTELIHSDDREQVTDQLMEVCRRQNAIVTFQFRHLAKSASYRWVKGTFTNLLHEPHIAAIVVKFTDITASQAYKQELENAISDLNKRNLDLNQFVYIISHNLRTPLSNLIGLIDILELEQLDDYNKGIVDLFKSSTDRLNETIFELTQILSLKSNQSVKISHVNIRQIFEKVCHSFNKQISQLNASVTASFNCESILFNKSYMESIFLNLLSNAIKYRHQDRRLEIDIALQKDEHKNCILTFSDNGLGIDLESNKDLLFGLHQRFHNHVKGNGVGLFITKSQIMSLGGKIEVSSTVDQGTQFKITFKGDDLSC